jgi:hypothetical protein
VSFTVAFVKAARKKVTEITMAQEQERNKDTQHADPVRTLAFQLDEVPASASGGTPPVKGGMKSTGTAAGRQDEANTGASEMVGDRSVYVLTRDAGQGEETPIVRAAPDGTDEAALVFSGRELAVLYLQVAAWTDYRVRELSALQLGAWAASLHRERIRYLMVDANRHHQEHGRDPGALIDLTRLADRTGENLYKEIHFAPVSSQP